VQPTITADRDWLHLEARYNYEALDTGSVWSATTSPAARPLAWTLTPMVGAVFGDTEGVAPGYRGSLGWKRFELYSEGEYLIDTGTRASNFMYTWSELTFAPVEQIRFGCWSSSARGPTTPTSTSSAALLLGVNLKRFQFTADDLQPGREPRGRGVGRDRLLSVAPRRAGRARAFAAWDARERDADAPTPARRGPGLRRGVGRLLADARRPAVFSSSGGRT
jgi:hypothetical protein